MNELMQRDRDLRIIRAVARVYTDGEPPPGRVGAPATNQQCETAPRPEPLRPTGARP